MRPGQTAPECAEHRAAKSVSRPRFNEAGADCPGMLLEGGREGESHLPASMRPGQTAPECQHGRTPSPPIPNPRFNEAGADCPGMPEIQATSNVPILNRFNEAGADCPGMRRAPRRQECQPPSLQ